MSESKKVKPVILVVDDIPSNLNFVSDILYSEGFAIVVTTNGKDAIQITRDKKPDLLLLDVAMPGIDGYEVCKILKEDPSTKEIPIIFLTAKVEHQDIVKGFTTGAVDYVAKPFNAAELISRVKTHLDLKWKSEQLLLLNQELEHKVRERTNELEETNQNLMEANKKLSIAYNDLTKLDQAKNEFIRHINHELRTPLQGISGFARILDEIVSSPEEKEYIHSINLLVKRLVKVAELSLLLTELRTDNYRLELETIDVTECIRKSIDSYEQGEKQINVVADNLESNLLIRADQKLMCACMDIFINNAIKYSPENSTIVVKSFSEDSKTVIEIHDSGPGFSDKAQDQIFDLFGADNRIQNSYGFGLGLATAKIILDLLSATMEVNNMANGGACVRLLFPAC